ncbi:NB-ARC domain-containing protein [[Phormidium] sp. ETS-05]|uniref:NB-ARC domain-containing protein n=1 Tax=[Phormidium] sp. ETS-05 TaxID=222819 RepID=UPI0018EF14D0|nr:NB-ARC domain-containing protein [[Phormidium] sp. ETS-05]
MLRKWILTDRAQLVALFGMGGIGKTALAGQVAQQIAGEFEYVGWRSLSNTPTVPQLLAELLGFFPCSPGKTPDLSPLLHYIQNHRSLIILDGLENLMTPGELAGKYREAYQDYALLFKTIGTTKHQSCFLITSTEKSREIGLLENFVDTVQCIKLTSLSLNAARQILQEQQLVDEDKWEKLIERYSGNPLALKLVSGIIKEVFHGQVGKFCRAKTTFLGEIIRENLAIQLSRLSDLEMQIIYQLAISSEPVDIDQLRQWVPSKYPISAIIEALKSLIWRSLLETVIEQDVALYILPPMFKKHIINNFTQPLI